MSNFQKLVKPYVRTSTHRLEVFNLSDANYFIFILRGYLLTDDRLVKTEAQTPQVQRMDINGQSILPMDYILEEWKGEAIIIKFIKANFPYILEESDDIRITGMFRHIPK